MADRTTINVTKEVHEKAKESKEEGESWSDYLMRCTEEEPTAHYAEIELDAETVRNVVSDEIRKRMEDITIDVDMSGLDLDGSDLDENDVRNIVESELEKTFGERLPQ